MTPEELDKLRAEYPEVEKAFQEAVKAMTALAKDVGLDEAKRLLDIADEMHKFRYAGDIYLGEEVSEGWLVWHTEGNQAAALMPAPHADWPTELHAAYRARVAANLTGFCPACKSDTYVIQPTAPMRASGILSHEAGCIVGDDGPLADALYPDDPIH